MNVNKNETENTMKNETKKIDVAELYENLKSIADPSEHEFDMSTNKFFDMCEIMLTLESANFHMSDDFVITYDVSRFDEIESHFIQRLKTTLEMFEYLRLMD